MSRACLHIPNYGESRPPAAVSQDLADRQHRRANLVVSVVKVRRDADAGFGAEVDLDVARQQLVGYFVSLRRIDGDGAGALAGSRGETSS